MLITDDRGRSSIFCVCRRSMLKHETSKWSKAEFSRRSPVCARQKFLKLVNATSDFGQCLGGVLGNCVSKNINRPAKSDGKTHRSEILRMIFAPSAKSSCVLKRSVWWHFCVSNDDGNHIHTPWAHDANRQTSQTKVPFLPLRIKLWNSGPEWRSSSVDKKSIAVKAFTRAYYETSFVTN